MVAAAILAGGTGTRMGSAQPKQYLHIGGEPILVRSVRAFLSHPEVNFTAVAVAEDRIGETKAMLAAYLGKDNPVSVFAGGCNRSESLLCAARFFRSRLPDDTILLTHDAARPFVTPRIIHDNIEGVLQHGAVGTAVASVDTVLLCPDGVHIEAVPLRSSCFCAQTPQSFRLGELTDLLQKLSFAQREKLTDGTSVYLLQNRPVAIVPGEPYNIKITYPGDLSRGESILLEYFTDK